MKSLISLAAFAMISMGGGSAFADSATCHTNWVGGACGLTEQHPGASYGGGTTVTTAAPVKECDHEKI